MSDNFEIDYAYLSNNFNLVDPHSLNNIETSSLLLFGNDSHHDAANPNEILKFNSVILNRDEANNDSNSNGETNITTTTSTTTTTALNSNSNSNSANKETGELAVSATIDKLQAEAQSETILNELVDDCLFGLILQVHRAAKLGYLMLNDDQSNTLDPAASSGIGLESDSHSKPTHKEPYFSDDDVLGFYSHCNEKTSGGKYSQSNSVNNALLKYECACPNCGRNIAAIRFAPHLEKCMGMGRSSSRIATRRIANYNGDELDQLIEATGIIYPKSSTTESAALHSSLSTSSLSSSTSSTLYSSSSASMINSYDQYLKPPAAKKKRVQPSLTKSATTILPVQAQATTKSNLLMGPSLSGSMHGHAHAPVAAAAAAASHLLNTNSYLIENYSTVSNPLKPAAPSIFSSMASASTNQPATSTNN